MRLTGPEHEELTDALLDAYPDQESLEMMLEVKLEKRLSGLAHGNSLRAIIFKLIRKAQSEGWTDKLIIAAHEWNPGNEMLQKCYQKFIQVQIMEVNSEETSEKSKPHRQQQHVHDAASTLDNESSVNHWEEIKVGSEPSELQQHSPVYETTKENSMFPHALVDGEDIRELEVEPKKVQTEVFDQSETSPVGAMNDDFLQDFLTSTPKHLAMIIEVFKPFSEGRIIYPEHCDRVIKSLDNLDESVQKLRKVGIEFSYNVKMALNHIGEQINELRIDLHQFRRISSSLTSSYLKGQQYGTGYRKIRSKFDSLLKSLEQFKIED